jgi:hypothetical protein
VGNLGARGARLAVIEALAEQCNLSDIFRIESCMRDVFNVTQVTSCASHASGVWYKPYGHHAPWHVCY